jgi:hypothetical protein
MAAQRRARQRQRARRADDGPLIKFGWVEDKCSFVLGKLQHSVINSSGLKIVNKVYSVCCTGIEFVMLLYILFLV